MPAGTKLPCDKPYTPFIPVETVWC